MTPNKRPDQLYVQLRAGYEKLQPYLQRPLTSQENDRRTWIIQNLILPIRNRISEIESGLRGE